MLASATALTFLCQNFAWAVCADGTTFPPGGFVLGRPPAVNWSPGALFSGTAGSIFVPDNSVFEHNDPAQPSTGGGHNWAFDQGSTTCKETDTGPAGGTPTAWQIPPNGAGCLILPVLRGGIAINVGDIPYQGETITPTCNPALLSQPGAPNPANTRLNQLGCSISHGVATTAQTATTFLFVTGVRSGLFAVPLVNVTDPVIGGDAGKIVGIQYVIGTAPPNYYSDIPAGERLTNGAVSLDGMFAFATSFRRIPSLFACLNPLGDPGDPGLPIDSNFSIPPPGQVKCIVVGNNNLVVDLTTAFGPDNQPYFGGQRTVNTFNADPGGSSPTAWPQCIFNGFGFANPAPTTLMGRLQAVFNAHSANHCGNAVPNSAFVAANVIQPDDIITHGSYMYASPIGGAVVQAKVTVDPVTGLSHYAFRTVVSGFPFVTGLGVADDLKSLMVFTTPINGTQTVIYRVPLCEDL